MEIIAYSSFNLDLAIDYTWNNWKQKQESIRKSQLAAQEESSKWLISQFQTELDDCLDRQFQSALAIGVLTPTEISIFSVVAHFQYKDINLYLRRCCVFDSLQWELKYLSKTIICLPEYLKTQILIELGKLKNESGLATVTES
ncbi:MAG: hypothetical protein KME54_23235 [Tolypothrix brevis GSE-NOS-MK-07-07A]|jgi:hypothetical protein|nr:hypothetical protein [Tolypothrix brevis GSE-NOS-MK-07-07A]